MVPWWLPLFFGAFSPPYAVLKYSDYAETMGAMSDWGENNIPLLDYPDIDLNTTYYFRWRLFKVKWMDGGPRRGHTSTLQHIDGRGVAQATALQPSPFRPEGDAAHTDSHAISIPSRQRPLFRLPPQ